MEGCRDPALQSSLRGPTIRGMVIQFSPPQRFGCSFNCVHGCTEVLRCLKAGISFVGYRGRLLVWLICVRPCRNASFDLGDRVCSCSLVSILYVHPISLSLPSFSPFLVLFVFHLALTDLLLARKHTHSQIECWKT